jgi:hypothetical protein
MASMSIECFLVFFLGGKSRYMLGRRSVYIKNVQWFVIQCFVES